MTVMEVIKKLWGIIKIVYVTVMSACGLAWICAWYDEDAREGLTKMAKKL